MNTNEDVISSLFATHTYVVNNPGDSIGLVTAMLSATGAYGKGFLLRVMRYEDSNEEYEKSLWCSEKCSALIILLAKHRADDNTLSRAMMLMTSNLIIESGMSALDFAKAVTPKTLREESKAEFEKHMTDFASRVIKKYVEQKGAAN